jgi:hypothetical protein
MNNTKKANQNIAYEMPTLFPLEILYLYIGVCKFAQFFAAF